MTPSIPRRSPVAVLGPVWIALTLALLAFGFYKAMTAPVEATMGNLYRVFYYHTPIAMISFLFPYLNTGGSIAFLLWRRSQPERAAAADAFALAAAEITVLYSTVGLVTGSLWGRAAWGIWWAWDARLTTYLLLWLLYVSYLMLRQFTSSSPTGGQTSLLSAILGIFAAIDVPICFMSIRWWRTQHPAPVFGGGDDSGIDPSMMPAWLWNVAAWLCWGILLLGYRYVLERRRQRLAEAEELAFLALPTAEGVHIA